MKKTILSLLAFTFLFFSCEEDKVIYNGSDFVTFDQLQVATLNLGEDQGSATIAVKLSKKYTTDVVVQIGVVNGTAVQGEHFSLPSSITIPAGQTSANLPITLVNDEDFNLVRRFEIKLSSTSVETLALGIGDEGSYMKKVSIINDDCPTQFGFWFGDLSIEDVGYGSTPGTGSANENGDCDKLVIVNNLPGMPSSTNNTFELIFTPDPEVPDGSYGTVVVNETISRTGLSNNTLNAVYTAVGIYDTTTGEVTLDYTVSAKNIASGAIVGTYWTGTNIIRLP